jgi:ABC-2 type transport system permease protein
VMEEKLSRISEMLLGSVSTFELMMGKLLGNAGTAILTSMLYLAAAYSAAYKFGFTDALTPSLIASLLLFVFLAIFLFGSLWMAVGSACSDMKDAQSMMAPVMMLSMLPIFCFSLVIPNPSGRMAVLTSMIPFATPTLMTMRMAMQPAPPAWQVIGSIILTLAATAACIWTSAKIFRTGLLMHGKAPNFREMARWVMAK